MQVRDDQLNRILEKIFNARKRFLQEFQGFFNKTRITNVSEIERKKFFASQAARYDFISAELLDKELASWSELHIADPFNKLITLNYILAKVKKNGDYKNKFDSIIKLKHYSDKNNINAYYAKAIALLLSNQHQEALKYFFKCTELAQNYAFTIDNDELRPFYDGVFLIRDNGIFFNNYELYISIEKNSHLLPNLVCMMLCHQVKEDLKHDNCSVLYLNNWALKLCDFLLENHLNVSEVLLLRAEILERLDRHEEASLNYSLSNYFKKNPLISKEITNENELLSAINETNPLKVFNDFKLFNAINIKLENFTIDVAFQDLEKHADGLTLVMDKKTNKEIGRFHLTQHSLIFTGYTGHIKLNIQGLIKRSDIIIKKMGSGEVTLNAQIDNQQNIKVSSNAETLICSGNFFTGDNSAQIIFTAQGSLKFTNEFSLVQSKTVQISAASFKHEGVIDADQGVTIQTKFYDGGRTNVIVSNHGNIVVIADNLKLRGFPQAKNIFFKIQNKAYIYKKAVITGFNQIVLSARKSLIQGEVIFNSSNAIVINTSDDVTFDESVKLFAKKQILIRTNKANNYCDFHAENIDIHATDFFANHSMATLTANEILNFSGGSVWNAGKLIFTNCNVSLNKVFGIGLAQPSDIFNFERRVTSLIDPRINGDNLNINASLYINLTSNILLKNLMVCAIAEAGVFGLSQTVNMSKTKILDLDYSIDIPNISELIRSTYVMMQRIITGNMQALADDLLTFNSLIKVSNVVLFIIRKLTPSAISRPIDMTWSLIMLAVQVQGLFDYCKKLYLISHARDLEIRDFIPLLQFTTGIANQGVQLGAQVDSVMHLSTDSWTTPALTNDLALSVTEDVASLLGPSSTSDSLINLSGGVHVTGSLRERALVSNTYNINVAANVNISNLYAHQHGAIIANNVLEQGIILEDSGITVANNLYVEEKNYIQNNAIQAQHAEFAITNWQSNGPLDLNDTVAKVEQLEMNSSSNLTQTLIATNSFHLATNANLDSDNLTVTAKNDMQIAGKIVQKNHLNLQAENCSLTQSSSIDGDGQVTIITKQVNLQGELTPNQLHVSADQFENITDLLNSKNQYENVKPKQELVVHSNTDITLDERLELPVNTAISAPNINVNVGIHSAHHVSLEVENGDLNIKPTMSAPKIQLIADQGSITATNTRIYGKDQITIDAKRDINIDQTQIGADVVVEHSSCGNITHTASTISASQFLEVYAEQGSIYNVCAEKNVWGGYDVVKAWTPAVLSGGTGKNYNGIGLQIYAGKEIVNDASRLFSINDMQVSAGDQFRTTARSHVYISYEKHKKNWYGQSDDKVETSVQLCEPIIASSEGQVEIESRNANVFSSATQFNSAQGTTLSGETGVRLTGLIAETKQYHSHSNLWGAGNSYKEINTDDVALPTYVIAPNGETIISSANGSVYLDNAIVHAQYLKLFAHDEIVISNPILNHSHYIEENYFQINFPFLNEVQAYLAGNFTNLFPLIGDVKALNSSNGEIETSANIWNTMVDGINESNRIIQGVRSGEGWQSILNKPSFAAVQVGYTHTATRCNYQTLAANSITAQYFYAEAVKQVSFQRIPIFISEDAEIHTTVFQQVGASLISTTTNETTSARLDFNAFDFTHAAITHSKFSSSATLHINQTFNVDGKLTVNAQSWQQNNANTRVRELTGEVDTCDFESDVDTLNSRASTASIATNGEFAFANAAQNISRVNSPSGIEIKQSAESVDFHANNTFLQGANIIAPKNSFSTDHLSTRPIKENDESHSYQIGGNINSFFGKNSSATTVIATVPVGFNVVNQESEYTSGIHSPNENFSERQLIKNEKTDFKIKLPIVNHAGLKQFNNNLAWLEEQLMPKEVENNSLFAYENSTENVARENNKEKHHRQHINKKHYQAKKHTSLNDDYYPTIGKITLCFDDNDCYQLTSVKYNETDFSNELNSDDDGLTISLLNAGRELAKEMKPFGHHLNNSMVVGLVGYEFMNIYDEESQKTNFDMGVMLHNFGKVVAKWDLELTFSWALKLYGYGALTWPLLGTNLSLKFISHNEKRMDKQFASIRNQYQNAGFYNKNYLENLSFWERTSVESAKARLDMAEGNYKAMAKLGSLL